MWAFLKSPTQVRNSPSPELSAPTLPFPFMLSGTSSLLPVPPLPFLLTFLCREPYLFLLVQATPAPVLLGLQGAAALGARMSWGQW